MAGGIRGEFKLRLSEKPPCEFVVIFEAVGARLLHCFFELALEPFAEVLSLNWTKMCSSVYDNESTDKTHALNVSKTGN